MIQGSPISANDRARFIEHLARTANISASARYAGFDRASAYNWREADQAFAAQWDAAMEEATDALEAEARRRAYEGVEEYVTCKDGLVLGKDPETGEQKPVMQRRYSDAMMALLLKAHRPERFRERSSVEMSVSGDMAALIEEGRKRARESEP